MTSIEKIASYVTGATTYTRREPNKITLLDTVYCRDDERDSVLEA